MSLYRTLDYPENLIWSITGQIDYSIYLFRFLSRSFDTTILLLPSRVRGIWLTNQASFNDIYNNDIKYNDECGIYIKINGQSAHDNESNTILLPSLIPILIPYTELFSIWFLEIILFEEADA